MPLSVFGMSLAQFFLLGGWLAAGGAGRNLRKAFRNKAVAALAGLYALHVLGLLYSTDLDYAFRDLRIKLPLLALPVLLATAPPGTKRHAPLIAAVLVAAVFVSTLASLGVLRGVLLPGRAIHDAREASLFISHIRLSLLVVVSVYFLAAFLRGAAPWKKAAAALLIAWFLYFLYAVESMTGWALLLLSALALGGRTAFARKKGRLAVLFGCLALPAALAYWIHREAGTVYSSEPVDFAVLDSVTLNGNAYRHYPDRPEQENAHRVWTYVCEDELAREWNRRSELGFGGRDRSGHELRMTLLRYLTSKGLRKDSAALASLAADEITAVENGVANEGYRRPGNLRQRLRKTIKEYYLFRDGANPTGSSMLQRLEYWQAGWRVFRSHWLIGVGTGDVQQAFDAEYERSRTRLARDKWHRAHNQFLTFAVTFGVPGLLYFIFTIGCLLAVWRPRAPGLYLAFWLVAVLSMLTEDTLETQAGVTFFVFLNCYFLFLRPAGSPPNGAPFAGSQP
jgi:hypothetical protein